MKKTERRKARGERLGAGGRSRREVSVWGINCSIQFVETLMKLIKTPSREAGAGVNLRDDERQVNATTTAYIGNLSRTNMFTNM